MYQKHRRGKSKKWWVALGLTCLMWVCVQVTSAQQAQTSQLEQLEQIFTTLDLMDATIYELQQAMEEGRVTSQELVEMYLDRIEAYDEQLGYNSIITVNPLALEQAQQLDEERAQGQVRGVLHGIPIVIKDNMDYAGLATTAGASGLLDSVPDEHATVVAKLVEAGAIVLAKTNLSEFALFGSVSRSQVGGTVHNAYDTEITPAGSSGGTAVAVTANFAAAGIGTDTASSIRRPSSYANLYGLRPSKGLTSIHGVLPLNADQDVTGPICRTVEDLAILLDVMAGTDEADWYTQQAETLIPQEGYTAYLNEDGLEGKRIGYLESSFVLDDSIQDMVAQALDTMEAAGAELVDLSEILSDELIEQLSGAVTSVTITEGSIFEWDVYEYFQDLGQCAVVETMAELVEQGGYSADIGTCTTPESQLVDPRFEADGTFTQAYEEKRQAILEFRDTVTALLEEYDIDAVAYVSQTDLPGAEAECAEDVSAMHNNEAAYINLFGPLAGLPEIMVPMGLAEGLPLGLSLFAGYGQDAALIEIAYGYQEHAQGIRVQTELAPALEDAELNQYLENLLELAESLVAQQPDQAQTEVLSQAVDAAAWVDWEDPQAVYDAAWELAAAYDALADALNHGDSDVPGLEMGEKSSGGFTELHVVQAIVLLAIVLVLIRLTVAYGARRR